MPVVIAFIIGTTLGVTAGYVGGFVNQLIMRTVDVFYAFPSVLLAIAISGALGAGILNSHRVADHRVRAADRARRRKRHHAACAPSTIVEAARASGAGS